MQLESFPMAQFEHIPSQITDDAAERELRGQLFAALVEARGKMQNPTKKSQGYGYDYADLSEVIACSQPALQAHGLNIIQFVCSDGEDCISVRTILTHKAGGWLEDTASMRVTLHKGMSREQCEGTAISYLRRYCWLAVCGLPQGDNDAAEPKTVAPRVSKSPKPPRPSGSPPITLIDGIPQAITVASEEWCQRAAAEHPDPHVQQWAAYLLAGGQA